MTNVKYLSTGDDVPDRAKPNSALIKMLEDALKMAESGRLQSYIGTGFTHDGFRVSTWGDYHDDKYQVLGALNWLAHDYVRRMSEGKDDE
jgi:hypothetical protein